MVAYRNIDSFCFKFHYWNFMVRYLIQNIHNSNIENCVNNV